MAYTKQPKQSTLQQKRIPAAGSYVPDNNLGQGGGASFLNCAPVAYNRTGQDPLLVVEPRPFLVENSIFQTRSGPLDGYLATDPTQTIIDGTYSIRNSTLLPAAGILTTGAGSTSSLATYMTEWVQPGTNTRSLIFSSPSNIGKIVYTGLTPTVTQIGLIRSGYSHVGQPVVMGGYVFQAMSDGNIYSSTTSDPLDFAYATRYVTTELFIDDIVTLAVHKSHVVSFNTKSIEFFFNAGTVLDGPLQRQENYALKLGIVKPGTLPYTCGRQWVPITEINDSIYFLGQDSAGSVSVYQMDNFQVKDIADYALKKLFHNAPNNILGDGTATDSLGVLRGTFHMCSMPAYGTTCLYIEFSTDLDYADGTSNTFTTRKDLLRYVYNPMTGVWSQWVFNALEDDVQGQGQWLSRILGGLYSSSTAAGGAPTQIDRIQMLIGSGAYTKYPYEAYMRQVTDGTATEAVLCEVQTGMIDFDSYYNKHFTTADILGNYDINTTAIGLETTKHTNYSSFVHQGWKTGEFLSDGVVRFNNLGVARHMNYKVKIATSSNFQYYGMDVQYDQGMS